MIQGYHYFRKPPYLWMEEILHHLGWLNTPMNNRINSLSTGAGFLPCAISLYSLYLDISLSHSRLLVSICLSICLSVCLSIYLSIYLHRYIYITYIICIYNIYYMYICTIDLYVLFERLPVERSNLYIQNKIVRLNYIFGKKNYDYYYYYY